LALVFSAGHIGSPICEQAERFRPATILIEDKASGTRLIQELIRENVHAAKRYEPSLDKVMRLHSASSTIENGFVYLPTEATRLAIHLHELTTFPNGKHDDQADSTSQALDWAKQPTHYYGVIEYYKQEALRIKTPTRSRIPLYPV
jgi:phage terminase large subunit-like protein